MYKHGSNAGVPHFLKRPEWGFKGLGFLSVSIRQSRGYGNAVNVKRTVRGYAQAGMRLSRNDGSPGSLTDPWADRTCCNVGVRNKY